MGSPTVGAALIVRNEEKFLPGCLERLQGVVDDIVVVDTGSVDSTIDIANRFNVRLLEFSWIGDFSAARNTALSAVKSDFALYIDADERLTTPGGARVADWLDAQRHAGATVRFHPRPGYTAYNEMRLFRADPSVRFEGKIHETHLPSLGAYRTRHNLEFANTPIIIDHLGYEGDQSHKVLRNIPLLRVEIERNPGRAYCWHHLAEMLAVCGRRPEAREVCLQGRQMASRGTESKGAADFREIEKTLARLLIEDELETDDLTDRLLEEAPSDWSIVYLHAKVLLKRKAFDDAISLCHRLQSAVIDSNQKAHVAFDRRLFGELAWETIGTAHFLAGRRQMAAQAFKNAHDLAPHHLGYRTKAIALGATG